MEENTMNTQNGENGTQQGTKTFTQEEVNRIVQERLARVKAEPSGKEEELNNREKELNARELKLTAKETFSEKGLPAELLDILDYSDETKMNEHIGILEKTYGTRQDVKIHGGKPYTGGYSPVRGGTPTYDPIREAMGLKR